MKKTPIAVVFLCAMLAGCGSAPTNDTSAAIETTTADIITSVPETTVPVPETTVPVPETTEPETTAKPSAQIPTEEEIFELYEEASLIYTKMNISGLDVIYDRELVIDNKYYPVRDYEALADLKAYLCNYFTEDFTDSITGGYQEIGGRLYTQPGARGGNLYVPQRLEYETTDRGTVIVKRYSHETDSYCSIQEQSGEYLIVSYEYGLSLYEFELVFENGRWVFSSMAPIDQFNIVKTYGYAEEIAEEYGRLYFEAQPDGHILGESVYVDLVDFKELDDGSYTFTAVKDAEVHGYRYIREREHTAHRASDGSIIIDDFVLPEEIVKPDSSVVLAVDKALDDIAATVPEAGWNEYFKNSPRVFDGIASLGEDAFIYLLEVGYAYPDKSDDEQIRCFIALTAANRMKPEFFELVRESYDGKYQLTASVGSFFGLWYPFYGIEYDKLTVTDRSTGEVIIQREGSYLQGGHGGTQFDINWNSPNRKYAAVTVPWGDGRYGSSVEIFDTVRRSAYDLTDIIADSDEIAKAAALAESKHNGTVPPHYSLHTYFISWGEDNTVKLKIEYGFGGAVDKCTVIGSYTFDLAEAKITEASFEFIPTPLSEDEIMEIFNGASEFYDYIHHTNLAADYSDSTYRSDGYYPVTEYKTKAELEEKLLTHFSEKFTKAQLDYWFSEPNMIYKEIGGVLYTQAYDGCSGHNVGAVRLEYEYLSSTEIILKRFIDVETDKSKPYRIANRQGYADIRYVSHTVTHEMKLIYEDGRWVFDSFTLWDNTEPYGTDAAVYYETTAEIADVYLDLRAEKLSEAGESIDPELNVFAQIESCTENDDGSVTASFMLWSTDGEAAVTHTFCKNADGKWQLEGEFILPETLIGQQADKTA